MRTLIKTIIATTLLASGAAQAHYLWIETAENGARLYYGEAEVQLKEKSPGKLDGIKAPRAFVPDTNGKANALTISRNAEYFAISGHSSAPAILAAEESLEVRDLTKNGLGFAKSNYYARNGQAANNTATPLVLDVKGNNANSFTILYRGQPLKNAKLDIIAPNTWMQEHTTDAHGMVQINTPWRGQYVLHVLHVDKTPGEFAGSKYDNLRNHLTFTFVKADGTDPGPAIAPKHPME